MDAPPRKRAPDPLRLPRGTRLVDVPGDGSCLFHAVYVAFYHGRRGVVIDPAASPGRMREASQFLRNAAVQYILKNYRRPLGGVRGNPTGRELVELEYATSVPQVRGPLTYARYMTSPRTYAGETELSALSGILRSPIVVHRADTTGTTRVYYNTAAGPEARSTNMNPLGDPVIHVAFDPRMQHYMALVPPR